MSRGPRFAAWALGALTAVALAGSVYRVPIQVSDSLEVIGRVIPMRHHLVFRGYHALAVQEHATDIAAYVAARFPPPTSCDGVQLPW